MTKTIPTIPTGNRSASCILQTTASGDVINSSTEVVTDATGTSLASSGDVTVTWDTYICNNLNIVNDSNNTLNLYVYLSTRTQLVEIIPAGRSISRDVAFNSIKLDDMVALSTGERVQILGGE